MNPSSLPKAGAERQRSDASLIVAQSAPLKKKQVVSCRLLPREVAVPAQFPPAFPATMVFFTVVVPEVRMPPPKNAGAELPEKVLLVNVSVALTLLMPPPTQLTELSDTVLLVSVSVAPPSMKIPPPTLVGNGSTIHHVSSAGGESKAVTELDQSLQQTAHRNPIFLPDGRRFIYFAQSAQPENTGIYVGSLDSRDRLRLMSSASHALYAPPFNYPQVWRHGTPARCR